jgi:hypothetical protein
MRAPNSGERKLAKPDFIRLKRCSAGALARWVDLARVARIEGILFQPEASGD